MKLANSMAIRDVDNEAIHILGIPSTLLMTNAAKSLCKAACEFLSRKKQVTVFCGTGNNGGDGICAAALLLRRGCNVRCFLVGNRQNMTQDALEMERRFIELGGILEDFSPFSEHQRACIMDSDVIIDAIFGIGLNSPIRGVAKSAIELINESSATVISADIASGVEADTGRILGDAVEADITITFSMAKIGHFVEPGCTCCGQLRVVDIGIGADLLSKAVSGTSAVLPHEISLPKRPGVSHKGDYGKLLIIGGSTGYTGAPALCAEAAAKSGAGLVSLGVPNGIFQLTATRLWEVMCFPLADNGNGQLSSLCLPPLLEKLESANACVAGCGLSRSDELTQVVQTLLREADIPLVIDADGLFALGNDPEIIRSAKRPPILTPHEGEFSRLGGKLTGDRVSDALAFARSRNCVLVLKGHRTICAFPEGDAHIIAAGNPGMAKGGSGDVLAGIIGGLVCQFPIKQAVITACMIHASAGDSCALRLGEYSMLPRDIIDSMPEIMKAMTK